MSPAPAAAFAPATFVRRYAAWSIDMALVSALALLACAPGLAASASHIGAAADALVRQVARAMVDTLARPMTLQELARDLLSDPRLHAATVALSDAVLAGVATPLLSVVAVALAWFALFEGARWQATPGKRLLGLRVVDAGGARIGWPRAFARQAAGALSWLTLNIGHLLALAPPRRQALHDRIAKACVVQSADAPARLPAWAMAWLALQGVAALAATLWLFVAMQLAMQRAFDALL